MPDTPESRRNAPASFQMEIAAHRLLALLRILREMPGYEANSELLQGILRTYGFNGVLHDDVQASLEELRQRDLVTLARVGRLAVVQLTELGDAVARGAREAHGVARAEPWCAY